MTTTRRLQIIVDQKGNAPDGISGLAKGLGALGGVAGGVATVGLGLATGGIAALSAGLVKSVFDASEAEDGQRELQAVLESTGMKAGVTADMANELAGAFQNTTKFSDDAILSGENMLLTFTNIGSDVFPMATEAMLNMAEKFGSMDAASVQLGKALNDPVQGVTALRRVGVQLTEAQEEQIKKFVEMGDIASAQKIILGELETEFGGLAVAAGETTSGKFTILQNKIGDISETLGGKLTPLLNTVADKLATGLDSPVAERAIGALGALITEVVIPGAEWLIDTIGKGIVIFDGWAATLHETVDPAMVVINDSINRIAQALGLNTQEWSAQDVILGAFKATLDAVVIGIKVAAVTIKLLADGVEQGRRNWETIKGTVNAVGDTFNSVMGSIRNGVNAAIRKWDEFKDAVSDAVDAIPDWLPGSPTPFEIGLRGIAGATGEVANRLPGAFAVNGAAPQLTPAGATGGGSAVIVNLTYAPMVSTADRFEVETKLIPLLKELLR